VCVLPIKKYFQKHLATDAISLSLCVRHAPVRTQTVAFIRWILLLRMCVCVCTACYSADVNVLMCFGVHMCACGNAGKSFMT